MLCASLYHGPGPAGEGEGSLAREVSLHFVKEFVELGSGRDEARVRSDLRVSGLEANDFSGGIEIEIDR